MAKRKAITEEMITKMMKSLGCTRDEAIDTIKDDMETDGMSTSEIYAEMTADEKAAIKESHKGAGKGGEKKKTRKPKDPNQMKIDMVNIVIDALKEKGFEIDEIVNPEREFTFIGPDGKPYAWTMKYCRNKDKGRD